MDGLVRIARFHARERKIVLRLDSALPRASVTALRLIRVRSAMFVRAVLMVPGAIWNVTLAQPALGGVDVLLLEFQVKSFSETGAAVLIVGFFLRLFEHNVNVVKVLQALIAAIAQ